MAAQSQDLLNRQLSKALAALQEDNFQAYLETLVSLGEWVQKKFQLQQYKNQGDKLEAALAKERSPRLDPIRFKQQFAFTVFQNAWQDSSLAHLKYLAFKAPEQLPAEGSASNACYFIKDKSNAGWKLFVFNAEGQKSEVNLASLDNADVAELLKKLPDTMVDDPSGYTIEKKRLAARMMRALKRANSKAVDQRSLTAKAELGKELRHQAKLGMETLHYFLRQQSLEQDQELQAQTLKKLLAKKEYERLLEQDILAYYQRQLDKKAREAILNYKTRTQKGTKIVGTLLAAITAFTYGGVELIATMLGFFVAACIVWSNPGLALAGVLLLAGAVLLPFFSTWTNWKVFSTYVPDFFNKIHSEYREINTKPKKALFWGLSLFALATGMAAGGLAYTATIAIPLMFGLGAISAAFPPLGMVFAAAIVITQTCMLIRNFATILRKENSWNHFKAPFFKVSKILNGSNASRGRRIVTWVMVAALGILAALGLGMSCFTSTRSVGKFFIDQLKTAPEKALVLGVVIAGIGSFLSRIYFTLDSAITTSLILCKRIFKANPKRVLDKHPQHYQIWRFDEELDPQGLMAKLGPIGKNDKIIVLTGKEQASTKAFFIKNKKVVNTDKGILKVNLDLKDGLENLDQGKSGLLHKAGEKQALFPFIQNAISAGTAQMLAEESKLPPISLKKVIAIIVDVCTAGAFYAQNMLSLSEPASKHSSPDVDLKLRGISLPARIALIFGGFFTAGTRYFVINTKHVDDPEDPDAPAKAEASARRSSKNIHYYREKNPNCIFTKAIQDKVEPVENEKSCKRLCAP